MKFPATNKPNPVITDDERDAFGENAKALEELAKRVDWAFLIQCYATVMTMILATIFALIVTVEFAQSIIR